MHHNVFLANASWFSCDFGGLEVTCHTYRQPCDAPRRNLAVIKSRYLIKTMIKQIKQALARTAPARLDACCVNSPIGTSTAGPGARGAVGIA